MSEQNLQDNRNYIGVICYWLPLLAYAMTIALVSSLSSPKVHLDVLANVFLSGPIDIFGKINDKIYHIVTYTILGLLTYRAIRFSWGEKLGPFAAFIAVTAVALYGITDEFHQWFVPFRNVETWDLIADTFGGLIGVSLWEWALTIAPIRQLEEQLPIKLQLLKNTIASEK
ncbi:MAG: VanZ family protein [Nitrospirales bacterium]